MRFSRSTSIAALTLLVLVALIATGCGSAPPSEGAKPGTVWEPSASGLPTLYVFSDPG